ncbi:MAG: hypothetical protein U0350_33650 [Caldilineaceae bacterium]
MAALPLGRLGATTGLRRKGSHEQADLRRGVNIVRPKATPLGDVRHLALLNQLGRDKGRFAEAAGRSALLAGWATGFVGSFARLVRFMWINPFLTIIELIACWSIRQAAHVGGQMGFLPHPNPPQTGRGLSRGKP